MHRSVSFGTKLSALATLLLTSGLLYAEGVEHTIGATYVSGATKVFDYYKDRQTSSSVGGIPVGLFYRLSIPVNPISYVDLGVGPFVMIAGDYSYHDVPIQASYQLRAKGGAVQPYARVGLMYHFLDGDHVTKKNPAGLIAAAGLVFGSRRVHFSCEAAFDTSKASFEGTYTNMSTYPYTSIKKPDESIAPAGFTLSVGVTF